MAYRIAHAQKSLSLVLKHLWAHGQLHGGEPPVCPVDRLVLKRVLSGPVPPWTMIDTVHEYGAAIERIREAAEGHGLTISVWELECFGGVPLSADPAGVDSALAGFVASVRWAAKDQQASIDEVLAGAVKDALRSSHNRSSLYEGRSGPRWPFLDDLRKVLFAKGIEYATRTEPLTEAQFVDDVVSLRREMRARHGSLFGR